MGCHVQLAVALHARTAVQSQWTEMQRCNTVPPTLLGRTATRSCGPNLCGGSSGVGAPAL